MNIDIVRRRIAALCRWPIWCLAGILSILSAAVQATIVIDFAYKITPAAPPLTQVYNNGRRTYFILAEDADPEVIKEIAASIRVTRDGRTYPVALDLSTAHPSITGIYHRMAMKIAGRQTTVIYIGGIQQPATETAPDPEPVPLAGSGEHPFIRKIPVPPSQEDTVDENPARDTEPVPAPAPPAPSVPAPPPAPVHKAPPPAAPLPLETKEMPNTQVVKVVARDEDSPPAAEAAVPAAADDVAEYKVRIPFAVGKTTLGKEGEKAMAEVTEIGPIAREIRIRAPREPGSDFQRAYGRAAEIHKVLARAGLVRQRISIEAVDAVPEGKVVHADIALIVDLGARAKR